MMRAAVVAIACVLVAACATKPTAPTSMASLPPAPPPGEPQDVAGMASAQLRVAFGAPAFVRKDGVAEMWRYDGASCKAFFFLYPSGNDMAVRHVETIPRGTDKAADPICLNTLRASPPVS